MHISSGDGDAKQFFIVRAELFQFKQGEGANRILIKPESLQIEIILTIMTSFLWPVQTQMILGIWGIYRLLIVYANTVDSRYLELAYLEVKIWSLFKHRELPEGNKILWKRGEIAPKEQFLLFSTIFSIHLLT